MPAATCEIDLAIREFLASLSPGTVIAQLADGSLAVCDSEDEADRKILASRVEPQPQKANEPRARAVRRKRRSLGDSVAAH